MNQTNINNKWGNLNYFNRFHIKNYALTSLFILVTYLLLYFTFDPTDMFSYTAGIYKHPNLYRFSS